MTQEAGVPRGFWAKVREIAREEVAKAYRSGQNRNSGIGTGGVLSVEGGQLQLVTDAGIPLFYVGPVQPSKPDGSPQQGITIRRADGTAMLALYDAFPAADGTLNQAANWFDRYGNTVLADDTDSGQGLARPYLTGGFGKARFADMAVTTTSATFETLWDTRITKQQPKLEVWYRATMDTAATTGEVQVLVNGVPWGAVMPHVFALGPNVIGPLPVDGLHMSTMVVEIQGRRTSATGALRVEPMMWIGRQT